MTKPEIIAVSILLIVFSIVFLYFIFNEISKRKFISNFEFQKTESFYIHFPHNSINHEVNEKLLQGLLKLKENGELTNLSVKNLERIEKEYKKTGVIKKEWIS